MVKNGDLIFESCGSILKFRLFQSQSIKNVHADTSGVSLSDDFELSVQSDVPVSSVPVPDEVGDDNDVLIDDLRLLHVIECVLSAEFKVLVASIAVPDEIGDDSSVLPDELEVSGVSRVPFVIVGGLSVVSVVPVASSVASTAIVESSAVAGLDSVNGCIVSRVAVVIVGGLSVVSIVSTVAVVVAVGGRGVVVVVSVVSVALGVAIVVTVGSSVVVLVEGSVVVVFGVIVGRVVAADVEVVVSVESIVVSVESVVNGGILSVTRILFFSFLPLLIFAVRDRNEKHVRLISSLRRNLRGDKNGQKGLDTVFFFYREIGVL